MIRLRLTSEYLAGPIFCPEPDKMGHVDVEGLPLSQELKTKVSEWDRKYQSTFNSDYPPDSGFSSPEAELQHAAEGEQLAKMIQQELQGSYSVEYCP
ncbi:hypothetical protein LOY70_03695 [Pseudomonas sp. B21-054]|jgi:hypothetical protein|uniref:hypothetical protein n=1 Tax=Pseudomonas sp. B21-054 TaxID=2895494 RepID=UPI00222F788D|nr:hypothetical protein [Pseudomonas sp. B21-054]UZE18712.1 hypothetical protein LOY70_03695 [Pseudomonas sp. B21-054]